MGPTSINKGQPPSWDTDILEALSHSIRHRQDDRPPEPIHTPYGPRERLLEMDEERKKISGICDRVITRIWQKGHICGISDVEIEEILCHVTKALELEPTLLEIEAPVNVFGDMHGQLADLLKWFTVVDVPPQQKVLFLGDYVDRGKNSLEIIMLLFSYKILWPSHMLLLRGNHEVSKMNRIHGFYEELRRKRSPLLWKQMNLVFNHLPLCARVAGRILCMHGGISPNVTSWDVLKKLKKPQTPKECDDGVAQDLMWSDPTSDSCSAAGFTFNQDRGCSFLFDEGAVERLCSALEVDFVCRAHEAVPTGHQWQFNNRLLTLFSAPNYCGYEGNSGSVMQVSASLKICFITLEPIRDRSAMTECQMEKLTKQMEMLEAKSPDPNARPTHKMSK